MHIHILGICGTFMGGLAALARESGHRVTGCDANVYPPMSDQLRALDIELIEGYGADQLALKPDLYVVGNVIVRGNPLMEAILDAGAAYTSGPQWLADNVLQGRHVLAVAGTHGKTSTTSMLAWALDQAGLARQRGQAAHEGAADAEDVDVHGGNCAAGNQRQASRAAAMVAAMSDSVCAALTKPASYSAGARYTPRSSMPWKKRLKRSLSVAITVA